MYICEFKATCLRFMAPGDRRLIVESPEIYESSKMQSYIAQEIARPCKQWIHDVLSSKREVERVKLRTDHFVLLPDVDSINKRVCSRLTIERPAQCDRILMPSNTSPYPPWPTPSRWKMRRSPSAFHWLAVASDVKLRTLRDLRGSHVPMLRELYNQACKKIQDETGIEQSQIMAYIHYPPSVYQLHVHFKHPVSQHVLHDTFRIHSVTSIINNLEIDSEYYSKSLLQVPVYPNTELYTALGLETEEAGVVEIQTQTRKKQQQQIAEITCSPSISPAKSPGSTRSTSESPREKDIHLVTSSTPV